MNLFGITCESTQFKITNDISDRTHYMIYIMLPKNLAQSNCESLLFFTFLKCKAHIYWTLDNINIQIFELVKYLFNAMRP